MSLIVDGVTYNVGVTSLKRKAQVLDKYAERLENGDLVREIIGVYFNYELTISPGLDVSEYAALWLVLTAAEEFHTVTLPDEDGTDYTFTAYISNVSDEIRKIKAGTPYWKNLTVNFIAKSPARTPA